MNTISQIELNISSSLPCKCFRWCDTALSIPYLAFQIGVLPTFPKLALSDMKPVFWLFNQKSPKSVPYGFSRSGTLDAWHHTMAQMTFQGTQEYDIIGT